MKTIIIAEAGVNHNGDIDLAKKLITEAAAAGADLVKFQTFLANKIVSSIAPKAEYQKRTTDSGESQFEMIQKLELSRESHEVLIEECRRQGIGFFSTAFDPESFDMLLDFGHAGHSSYSWLILLIRATTQGVYRRPRNDNLIIVFAKSKVDGHIEGHDAGRRLRNRKTDARNRLREAHGVAQQGRATRSDVFYAGFISRGGGAVGDALPLGLDDRGSLELYEGRGVAVLVGKC